MRRELEYDWKEIDPSSVPRALVMEASEKAHGELIWRGGNGSGAKGGVRGFEIVKISSSMNSSMT